jgi:cysteine desulfurase
MSDRPIYLDNNATTPIDPAVLEAMMPWLTNCFGNAASQTHEFGREARGAVDVARAEIARLIAAKPEEIVFTSGATESTNLALRGYFEGSGLEGLRIVSAPTEHKATLDTVKDLARKGAELVMLEVDHEGAIALEDLEAAILPGRTLVSLMMVNNEIGLIHPVAEIGAICRRREAIFHCDAAQAFGKIPIDLQAMGIDLLSVSGHKIYAPKGVGILAVGPRADCLAEQILGGGHEGGRRSGTLNVPSIVGLGAAARIAAREIASSAGHTRIRELRERLHRRLEDELGPLRLNGPEKARVDGNLNLSFEGVDPEMLMLALPGIAVSSGSACNSDTIEPSYVLKAIGLSDLEAATAIRFGIGRFNTEEEIDRAADEIIAAVGGLRAMKGA